MDTMTKEQANKEIDAIYERLFDPQTSATMDKETQDKYSAAWTLHDINLPSGGDIEINYESDDYQYVQDKHTMQMFKVVGAAENLNNSYIELIIKGSLLVTNRDRQVQVTTLYN